MKKKFSFCVSVFVMMLVLSVAGFSDDRGITEVHYTSLGNGTNNVSFLNPYTNTTQTTWAGVILGKIDNGDISGFYCIDIRNYLGGVTEIYNDSSYSKVSINYILLNYMPYKPYPYAGAHSDINIEAAAVQCAIWHFSDNVDANSINISSVKTRALQIIADAIAHPDFGTPIKNIQIIPVNVLPDPLVPAVLKVKVVNELGVGIPNVTVSLSATTGNLSTSSLVTGPDGFTPTFTVTKNTSFDTRISASSNYIVLSPGTIFIHSISPDVKQKITLAQAKNGNKIDFCEITWDSTSGGNGGGLESSYDLGELLLQRYMKIRSGQTTKMLAQTNFMFAPNYLLQDVIPVNGPFNSVAVETTPFDILGISNATSAFACDYKVNSNRVGAVFATTTNPPDVYNHTKATCDRYSKYELIDLKGVNLNSRDFYMAKLLNPRKNVTDYSITFSVYETVTGFIVDNKWTIQEHQVPSGAVNVYNFQAWAGTEFSAKEIVTNIISKLNTLKPVSYVGTQIINPEIYIKKASYDNDGKLRFKFANSTTVAKTLPFTVTYRPQQGMPEQTSTININIQPEVSEVVVPFGYLSGANITMNCENGFKDAVFVGGGLYAPFAGPNSVISGFENIVNTTPQFPAGTMAFTGGARIYGYTNDVLYIGRSLDATYEGISLTNFNKIRFEAKGTGILTVQLEAWANNQYYYPYVNINLTSDYSVHEIPLSSFMINGAPADLSAVSLVLFKQEVLHNPSMTYSDFSVKGAGIIPSTVGISGVETQVKDYELSQNYPNPFNPVTNINVSIPKEGFVTLKVYNMLGQEVAVLLNGNMKPVSNFKVTFDGSKLPTGVYVYKLSSTDGTSLIKKMTLIK